VFRHDLGMMATDLDALKLHRRTLVLDGRAFTVLTPRPSQPERFATNSFHGTWHVLTDPAGALLLARLMWAMAFQRKPRTVLLVDGPMLVTNPFDADPSSPILLVNSDLGGPSRAGLDALEALLPLRTPSEGTVKLRIDGLARALKGDRPSRWDRDVGRPAHQRRNWIDRVQNVLVFAAAAPELRNWGEDLPGTAASVEANPAASGLDAEFPNHAGEVQIFSDFRERVARAQQVRRRLYPGREHVELLDLERQAVWAALSPPPDEG
jgi:hypothetical protein